MAASGARTRGARLSDTVAADLRSRLEAGEWTRNEKLPSEGELTEHYGVSRATVRTALHALDRHGLTVTIHGVGTFATAAGQAVAGDLQRLESISETIVRMGRVPSSRFHSTTIRPATTVESSALAIEPDTPMLATQREILADEEIVAFSHDAVPVADFGEDFDMAAVDGSLFALLEDHGVDVRTSLTEIRASRGDDIGWATTESTLYVLLEQAHFDARNRGVAYSRTWFIEDRFRFSLVRKR